MEKKWILMIFGIYLSLACLISGIASVSALMDIVDNVLNIVWPNEMAEDAKTYYTPNYMKNLVKDIIGLIVLVPIFVVHLMMFRKEIKK